MAVTHAVWTRIEARDLRLMRCLHHWKPPRWVRILVIAATRMGDGWVWYALGGILLAFGGEQRFLAVASGASATLAGVIFFRAVKGVSRRKRPCEIEPHCWSSILPPDKYSFPSGHSISAFAIALSIGLFYPELQVLLLLLAVLIAASRIVLGMHFLSDVLAGSLIGSLLGWASFHLFSVL